MRYVIVDRPDEFESFVLLDVFEEEESLDLLLLEGEGGGMWRGKGEPGQIIKDPDQHQVSGSRIKDQGLGPKIRTKDQDQEPLQIKTHCHCFISL